MQNTNLLLIFLTGLTTGGLSCLAVQGGLLAAVISKRESSLTKSAEQTPETKMLPLITFLVSKLVAYTILGALLGLLGNSISLSPIARGYLQIAIAIYLIGVAGATLDLHPLFRYFIITPPKFLARLVKDQSRSDSIFAPALLGAFTVFLPCATTQAMEVIALGMANPLYGAAIMFAFVLGTSPTFFVLGFIFTKLSDTLKSWFYKLAAALMIIISLTTLNAGLTLINSPYTFQNFVTAASGNQPTVNDKPNTVMGDNIQSVTITVKSNGYSPKNINIKKGIKTRVTIDSQNVQSCARAFTIPSLNIEKLLPINGATIIEFTPEKLGPLAFACSMGMYTGSFNVVN